MLTSGYLAIAGSGYLAPLPVILTGVALGVRALMVAGIIRLNVPPRVATFLTLGYIAFFPADYFLISRNFLPATVHLIFFVAVTKILTASTNRDYLFVKTIALVELLAACLLSSNSNFFLFLGFFLMFTVAALASDEVRRSGRQSNGAVIVNTGFAGTRLAIFSASLSVGILVITGGLFFLLPRTARAALQHLIPARYHLAGFSNEVDLGEIGEIKKQDTPVLHILPQGGAALSSALKWRGATLGAFDGKRWFNPPGMIKVITTERRGLYVLATPDERRRLDPRLTYIVHSNEIAGDALFFAGKPEFVWIDAPYLVRTSPGIYRRQTTAAGSVTYQVRSFQDNGKEAAGANEQPEFGNLYLQLPPIDPRVKDLAVSVTAPFSTPLARARALENYLRSTYKYTLDLPAIEPRDPISFFLFERRKGHCEYFASSMAVMTRMVGLPSRVVTGFQGGVYNPISGQQLIRASDAHSWVEVWIPGRGWTTFDPTPADLSEHAPGLWSNIALYLDAADVFWQEWVLNYSLDHQLVLAARMEDSSRRLRVSWPDNTIAWVSGSSVSALAAMRPYRWPVGLGLLLAGLLWSFGPESWRLWRGQWRIGNARRGRATAPDATLLYERMLRKLKQRGVEKPPWLTPIEFARAVREPELAELTREITDAYYEVRFGGRLGRAARMVELLERIK
jgi:transglutaminase-like putative cysteine protease